MWDTTLLEIVQSHEWTLSPGTLFSRFFFLAKKFEIIEEKIMKVLKFISFWRFFIAKIDKMRSGKIRESLYSFHFYDLFSRKKYWKQIIKNRESLFPFKVFWRFIFSQKIEIKITKKFLKVCLHSDYFDDIFSRKTLKKKSFRNSWKFVYIQIILTIFSRNFFLSHKKNCESLYTIISLWTLFIANAKLLNLIHFDDFFSEFLGKIRRGVEKSVGTLYCWNGDLSHAEIRTRCNKVNDPKIAKIAEMDD